MDRNPSLWNTSLPDDLEQAFASLDGQQEQEIIFPVCRREDAPSSPVILTSVTGRNSGQQPTRGAGTSHGQSSSKIQTNPGWDNVAAGPSSPIDISAVEEESLAGFTDTPWTIARRLARTNKRKGSASRAGFGPKFARTFRPPDAPESPRITLHPPSNSHHHRSFGQSSLRDRSAQPVGSGDLLPKTWSNLDQRDSLSPNQKQVMDASPYPTGPQFEPNVTTSSDPLSPGKFTQSSSPIQHRPRGKRCLYPVVPDQTGQGRLQIHQISTTTERRSSPWDVEGDFEAHRQASPPWSSTDRSGPTPLPASTYSKNDTEYTGIENTTSAIDPNSVASVPEDYGLADDTFGNYYRVEDFTNAPGYEPQVYEHEERGFDTRSYNPGSQSFVEMDELDEGQYYNESADYYYPAEATEECMVEETWDDGQSIFDQQEASRRGPIDLGGTSRYSEGGSTGTVFQTGRCDVGGREQQDTDFRRRGSSKVGRLSRYTRRTPYRAPAYARGSSSSRIPPEVYRYKPSGLKPKKAFHEAISGFKFKSSRPHPHPHREHPKPPLKPVKLSCLYEPAEKRLDGKRDTRGHDEEGAELPLPALRSRAIKPPSLRTSEPSERTPRSEAPPSLYSGHLQQYRPSQGRQHGEVDSHTQKRTGHRQRERSRSESITLIKPQRPSRPQSPPLPTRCGMGADQPTGVVELESWPQDAESSGSESIEVVEPTDRVTSSGGVMSRRCKTDRPPNIRSIEHCLTESRRDQPRAIPANSSPSHPSALRPATRLPKTIFLKYDFNRLSVQNCRALRELLEDQVGRKRGWSDDSTIF